QGPLAEISQHVVQSPCVGFQRPCFVKFSIAVFLEVAVLLQRCSVVAKGPCSVCPGAACIFPFCLGGQSVEHAGGLVEPLAIHQGGLLTHAIGRMAIIAPHSPCKINVLRCGTRHCVNSDLFCLWNIHVLKEGVPLGEGDFSFTHP